MSILVKEDYVNPETPLWASNGSGGGGGGGPVISLPVQTGNTPPLTPGDSVTITTIDFPAEIQFGDDFIFQVTINLNDFDVTPAGAYAGALEYILFYTSDVKNWASTGSIYFATGVAPGTTLTLTGYREASSSSIALVVVNRVPGKDVELIDVIVQEITFTRVGTGYVPPPP